MGNIYLAVNGDNVGERIGEAIANDDHEGLSQASHTIQGAHDSIDQWIDSMGGRKITSAGDDAIYLVSDEAISGLDSIRENYKQQSGHGLTIGVGSSMSQASKALIYGKLNGKDQTTHYDSSIEDYLAGQGGGEGEDEETPEIPQEEEVQGQTDADMESDAGAGELEEAPVEGDQDQEEGDESADQEMAPQDDEMGMEPEAGTEEDMADDNQMASQSPAPPMADEDTDEDEETANTGAIDGKTDKDFGTSSEDFAEDEGSPEEVSEGTEEDLPDTDMGDDAAAELGDDSELDPNAEMGEEEGDDSAPEALGMGDLAGSDGMEGDEDQDDGEDPLASMIHGDMQEEEGEEDGGVDQDPSADMGEEGEDSSLDDELRQDIASALVAFKENKDMLEQAREENPKLYDATLTMLRSMIAMAKKLGFGPEQDMADQESTQQLNEEFPAAEGGEEGSEEEMPEEDDEQPEEFEESEEESEEEAPPMPPKKGAAPPAKK